MVLCDFMGLKFFLVYSADAPNKRGEGKQASKKKTWATHEIHCGLPKKVSIIINTSVDSLRNLFRTHFPFPCEYIRLWYSYYVQMTDNRYYSNVSKIDAIKCL